jgi:rhodanese-related sulfurtransferase
VLVLAGLLGACLWQGFPVPVAGPPASGALNTARAFKEVSVEDFDTLRAGTNIVLLDVRTPREFAAGHIPGAINLDWNAADFAARAAKLDASKTYLVNCATGRRSALACDQMVRTLGLTNCVNLQGGFRAWSKAGKPVAK